MLTNQNIHVCFGDPDRHLESLRACARNKKVENWTIDASAAPGDIAVFYMKAPLSEFVAWGTVVSAPLPDNGAKGWKGHFMADVTDIEVLSSFVPIRQMRDAFPEWGWLRLPRRSTKVPAQHANRFLSFLKITPADSHEGPQYWRMAMKQGSQGPDCFPFCRERGIAAIGYTTEDGKDITGDCRKLTDAQYKKAWQRRWPKNSNGMVSLRRVAREMRLGDIIYVKDGKEIACRGTIVGEYEYDPRLVNDEKSTGGHFVRVDWEKHFKRFECKLGAELWTVLPLRDKQLVKILAADAEAGNTAPKRAEPSSSRDRARAGGGFGEQERNREVEQAAIRFVTDLYRKRGWAVKSVEADKCGYDLICSNGESDEEHVEVKGVYGDRCAFPITAGEVRQAQEDSRFRLYVVTNALSGKPQSCTWRGHDIGKRFDLSPIQYFARLKD